MEIPARNFYRYLVLCGKNSEQIAKEFDKNLLLLPPSPREYFERQVIWAIKEIQTTETTVPTALRRAKMHDMWSAFKNRKAGESCRIAYHIANQENFRKPVEALLLAGWSDWEVAASISDSVTHTYSVPTSAISAYRRYFFDPGILSARDRQYLAIHEEHLRIAMLGLGNDELRFAVRLRYNTPKDHKERAYELAWQTWIVTLESMPIRTDRESIKALASFLSTLKSLDRIEEFKDVNEMNLIQLLKQDHPSFESPLTP